MKNREPVLRKLDSLESSLSKFNLALNRGNRNACYNVIADLKTQIEQIRSYINSEPTTGSELNKI